MPLGALQCSLGPGGHRSRTLARVRTMVIWSRYQPAFDTGQHRHLSWLLLMRPTAVQLNGPRRRSLRGLTGRPLVRSATGPAALGSNEPVQPPITPNTAIPVAGPVPPEVMALRDLINLPARPPLPQLMDAVDAVVARTQLSWLRLTEFRVLIGFLIADDTRAGQPMVHRTGVRRHAFNRQDVFQAFEAHPHLPRMVEQVCDAWLGTVMQQIRREVTLQPLPPADPADSTLTPHFTYADHQRLIVCYAWVGRPAKAWMVIRGVPVDRLLAPTTVRPSRHLATLLNCYARTVNVAQGKQTWQYFMDLPFERTPAVYSTYIKLLLKAQDFTAAQAIFKQAGTDQVALSTVSCLEILHHLAADRDRLQAHSAFARSIMTTILGDRQHFLRAFDLNNLIRLAANLKDEDLVCQFYDHVFLGRRYRISDETYSAFIFAFHHCGRPLLIRDLIDRARRWFHDDLPRRLTVTLIRGYAHLKDYDGVMMLYQRLNAATDVAQLSSGDARSLQMSLVAAGRPLEATAIYARTAVDPADPGAEAMHENMIEQATRQPDRALVAHIRQVIARMAGPSGARLHASLTRACGAVGDQAGVQAINRRLLDDRHSLAALDCHDVVHWVTGNLKVGNYATAIDIYRAVRRDPTRLGSVLYSVLVQACTERHDQVTLRLLYGDLQRPAMVGSSGPAEPLWSPPLLVDVIEAFLRDKDFVQADLLLNRILTDSADAGDGVDQVLRQAFTLADYNRLLSILGPHNRTENAWQLFRAMLDTHIVPNEATYIELCRALAHHPNEVARLHIVVRSALDLLTPTTRLTFCVTLFISLAYLRNFETLSMVLDHIITHAAPGLPMAEPERKLETCVNLFEALWIINDPWLAPLLRQSQYSAAQGSEEDLLEELDEADDVMLTEKNSGVDSQAAGSATPTRAGVPAAHRNKKAIMDLGSRDATLEQPEAVQSTLLYSALLQGFGILPYTRDGTGVPLPIPVLVELQDLTRTGEPEALLEHLHNSVAAVPNHSHPTLAITSQVQQQRHRALYTIAAFALAGRYDAAQDFCALVRQYFDLADVNQVVAQFLPVNCFAPLVLQLARFENLPLVTRWLRWMQDDGAAPYRAYEALAISTIRGFSFARRSYVVKQLAEKFYRLDNTPKALSTATANYLFPPPGVALTRFPAAYEDGTPGYGPDGYPLQTQPTLAISPALYARLVRAYVTGDYPLLVPWVLAMMESGLHPTVYLWTSIFKRLRKPHQLPRLRLLHRLCCAVHESTHDAATSLSDSPSSPRLDLGPYHEGPSRLDCDIAGPLPPGSGRLPLPIFSALMRAYGFAGARDVSYRLWQAMTRESTLIQPNPQTLAVAFDCAGPGAEGLLPAVLDYSAMMNLPWTTNVYTSLIEAYCRLGQYTQAFEVLTRRMRADGVTPDAKLLLNFRHMLYTATQSGRFSATQELGDDSDDTTEEGVRGGFGRTLSVPAKGTSGSAARNPTVARVKDLLSFIENNPYIVLRRLNTHIQEECSHIELRRRPAAARGI
ncbi:hypothetical protein IWQ60_003120 [Tieghemiomyces parasiticus]|uniref:Pentacotripeptide-repeat region of PRORP domain-containing protein n=1 Tax=Tieghemiomyces parasiticus TaxID=78921 RepID=A0A9W8E0D4_9FUNG|nr:hypothetical protein IWQ60_003120 [Tieghemiomyces parasiticus]